MCIVIKASLFNWKINSLSSSFFVLVKKISNFVKEMIAILISWPKLNINVVSQNKQHLKLKKNALFRVFEKIRLLILNKKILFAYIHD